MELTETLAASFARIALSHVTKEYPHKLDHVLTGDANALPPRVLHPIFYGSFDWHSCVHGYWTLLTLRRMFPAMAEAGAITALADDSFNEEKLAAELAYVERPSSRGFERPYGWAWLLYLHHEAARHTDKPWAARMEPLARRFARQFRDFLPLLTYPITVGTHFNTAFALILAREWAEGRDGALLAQIDAWAEGAFAHRTDYRGWEPGGDEFLSPALTAAMLIRRVWPAERFAAWFADFLPEGRAKALFQPAHVSDRSDGKIAHLDGLNLSRAWCLYAVAAGDAALTALADRHLAAAMDHVAGDYMGEHWLASFALLAILEKAKD